MNTTPTLRNDGLVLEYFLATCPNWTEHNTDNHFRAEASMTGDTNQYLKKHLPVTLPDACSVCDSPLNQDYSVVTWSENQRVKEQYALEAIETTHGHFQLAFQREHQPTSPITKNYFPDNPDTPLYVTISNGTLYATTNNYHEETLELPETALETLCKHYPVEITQPDDSPLKRHPE